MWGEVRRHIITNTFFLIYINDLVKDVKDMNIGMELDQEQMCILIYADNIGFLKKTEYELECILDVIGEWGRKWHVKLNGAKSNVVHFRKLNTAKTNRV